MKSKFRILKYEGDDRHSYAIFHSKDVKGLKSPVLHGQARPVISGLGRHQASYHKKVLEENCNG